MIFTVPTKIINNQYFFKKSSTNPQWNINIPEISSVKRLMIMFRQCSINVASLSLQWTGLFFFMTTLMNHQCYQCVLDWGLVLLKLLALFRTQNKHVCQMSQKRSFLTVWTRWLDFDGVKKGQVWTGWKNRLEPVSIRIFSLSIRRFENKDFKSGGAGWKSFIDDVQQNKCCEKWFNWC